MAAVLLALLAAVLLALASTIEQHSAEKVPVAESLRPRLLVRLAHEPRWLFGFALSTFSFPLEATALGLSSLVVVEPIVAGGIALVVPIGWAISRRRPRDRDLLLAAIVAGALAAFLVAGNASGGKQDGEPVEWMVAAAISVAAAGALAFFAVQAAPALRGGLLGTGAGLLFGVQSALLKATVALVGSGPLAVIEDWHVYALVVTGFTALTLEQSAYQTGSLAPSITATKLMSPVMAVALGLLLFDERFTNSGPRLLVVSMALTVALVALMALSWNLAPTSEAVAERLEEAGTRPGD